MPDKMKPEHYNEWMLSSTQLSNICPDCNKPNKLQYDYHDRLGCCTNCGVIQYEPR